jgi:predicted Fe-Mo cluster-binding NifX family protein
MKIAISTDNNFVSAHFGRCPCFTVVEIENGKLISKQIIDNPGHHPGFLPQFLHEKGISCIIAGGMGQRASELFREQGIQTIVGITGSIDETIDRLIKGEVEGTENICRPGLGKGYGLDKTEYDHPGSEDKRQKAEATPRFRSKQEGQKSENKRKERSRGMRICVTAQGDSLDSQVDSRFGRCPYFLIVDSRTLEYEAVENPSAVAGGGAGVQSGQLIAGKDVKVVLTGNVGPNAFQTLDAAGIKIITGVSGVVRQVIEKYKNGELKSSSNPSVERKFGLG